MKNDRFDQILKAKDKINMDIFEVPLIGFSTSSSSKSTVHNDRKDITRGCKYGVENTPTCLPTVINDEFIVSAALTRVK